MPNTETQALIDRIRARSGAPEPILSPIQFGPKQQPELTQTKMTLIQRIRARSKDIPVVKHYSEALFGTGAQLEGLDGRTHFDTGFVGFFRPFTIGKPRNQKIIERAEILKSELDMSFDDAVKVALLDLERVKRKSSFEQIRQGVDVKFGAEPPEEIELPADQKKALRWVNVEESLDKLFGALDFVSFGVIKPVRRTVLQQIAKTKSANKIFDLLTKEIPNVSDEARRGFSDILTQVDSVDDVQRVMNRIENTLKGVEAGKAADETALVNRIKARSTDVAKKTPSPMSQVVARIKARAPEAPVSVRTGKEVAETAEEFVKIKQLDSDSVLIKDSKRFIVEDSAGKDALLTEIPIRSFGKPKFETLNEVVPKAGRPITDPIEVVVLRNGEFRITDGANRFTQAVANGDETIPVILSSLDGTVPSLVKPETPILKPEVVDGGSPIPRDVTDLVLSTQPTVVGGFEVTPILGAGSLNEVDTARIIADSKQTPDFIAMKTTKDGGKVAAIREDSGIFVPKDFETHDFIHIGKPASTRSSGLNELLDKYVVGKSYNFRDAALAMDGKTAQQVAKDGSWGPMVNLAYDIRNALGQADTWSIEKAMSIKIAFRENGLANNKKTRELLFAAMNGDKSPPVIQRLADDLRPILDKMRDEQNVVRVAMGRSEIGYVTDYIPYMEKVNFWTGKDVDDIYYVPNAKKNPHAIPREPEAKHVKLEKDFGKLMESYIHSASQDIFVAAQIERLKGVSSVMRGRGLTGNANFIDSFIRENIRGMVGPVDEFLRLEHGSIGRRGLNHFIAARNIKALASNIVWIVTVQPASLASTVARAGGITRGFQNTLGGMLDFAIKPALREKMRNLPVIVSKTNGASVGMTGAGDLDKMAARINTTRIENITAFTGQVADNMEYFLTMSSIAAGYRHGKQIGLVGKELDMYADLMGGATQSEYNALGRPLMLNSAGTRGSAPFQTFSAELYRLVKTIVGKGGGLPLEKKQRINVLVALVVSTYAYNEYHDRLKGRKLTTLGSFIPLIGGQVDKAVSFVREKAGFPTGEKGRGRSPIAPLTDAANIKEAFSLWINEGNIQPLRKELIGWSMGFSRLGGAATVNTFIDGMIANSEGFQRFKSGDLAFRVEGFDKVIAPFMGPWSTVAGKDYVDYLVALNKQKAEVLHTFYKVERLNKKEKYDEAEEIINALTDDEWKAYKRVMEDEEAKEMEKLKRDIFPTYTEVEKLNDAKKYDEAEKIIEALSDEEWEAYEMIMKEVKGVKKFEKGSSPYFRESDIENSVYIIEGSVIKTVKEYAIAIGTDPAHAFELLFAGEKLRRTDNGTIIIKRIVSTDLGGTEAPRSSGGIKEERAEGRDLDYLRLDHHIPLQLGGDNSDENLKLIPIGEHAAYTPLENYLGKLLRNGTIKGDEAQRLIIDFKEGRITADEIYNIK